MSVGKRVNKSYGRGGSRTSMGRSRKGGAYFDPTQPAERLIARGNCPMCLNPLVSHVGRHAQSIRCSNFPDCRYVQVQVPIA